jgi:hypothetical protein
MFLKELLTALIIALTVSLVFALLSRREGRRTGFVYLFLIIFMATWAGGVWIRPFGPPIGDVYWLGFLMAGLIVALLLALFLPQRPPRGREETLDALEQMAAAKQIEEVTYFTLGALFWLVLLLFLGIVVLRYVIRA